MDSRGIPVGKSKNFRDDSFYSYKKFPAFHIASSLSKNIHVYIIPIKFSYVSIGRV